MAELCSNHRGIMQAIGALIAARQGCNARGPCLMVWLCSKYLIAWVMAGLCRNDRGIMYASGVAIAAKQGCKFERRPPSRLCLSLMQ